MKRVSSNDIWKVHNNLLPDISEWESDCSSTKLSANWDNVRRSLSLVAADEGANKDAVSLAASLLAQLAASGSDLPEPTLDADGDVVLTWHRGSLKGSAIVTGNSFASLVSYGARLLFVQKDRPANAVSIQATLGVLSGGGECSNKVSFQYKKYLSRTQLDGKFLILHDCPKTQELQGSMATQRHLYLKKMKTNAVSNLSTPQVSHLGTTHSNTGLKSRTTIEPVWLKKENSL